MLKYHLMFCARCCQFFTPQPDIKANHIPLAQQDIIMLFYTLADAERFNLPNTMGKLMFFKRAEEFRRQARSS